LRLERAIQGMIQDDMHVLFHLHSDDLGQRLMALSNEMRPYPGDDVNAVICGKLARDMFKLYSTLEQKIGHRLFICEEGDVYTRLTNEINILESLEINAGTTQYDNNYIRFILNCLMSVKASVTSSFCIQYGQNLPPDIWQLYGESLNVDVASSNLKLASMHYC